MARAREMFDERGMFRAYEELFSDQPNRH
jgi:hypothetical protein